MMAQSLLAGAERDAHVDATGPLTTSAGGGGGGVRPSGADPGDVFMGMLSVMAGNGVPPGLPQALPPAVQDQVVANPEAALELMLAMVGNLVGGAAGGGGLGPDNDDTEDE